MAPFTVTEAFRSSLPASKIFQTYVYESEQLLPKIAPDAIKSIQTIQGCGEVGTIRLINFADGTHAKSQVEAIDKEGFLYKWSFVEGDMLKEKNLERIVHEIKVVCTGDGKCNGNETVTYIPKDSGAVLKEDDVKDIREKGKSIYGAVEAYLLANP